MDHDHENEKTSPSPTASVSVQPAPVAPPKFSVKRLAQRVTSKDGWVGEYDFAWLWCVLVVEAIAIVDRFGIAHCSTPTLPFVRRGTAGRRRAPPFYALDDELPILLAIVCGYAWPTLSW